MSLKTCDDEPGSLDDLFVAGDARPSHLKGVAPETLSAFARVMLITDGTVTHMLRAHFREPVEVQVEAHEFIKPAKGDADRGIRLSTWLGTRPGDEILVRDVVLIGTTSGREFASARSYIALERLSPDMRDDITEMRRSIGNVLLAHFSENRRELLWHGLNKGRLERTYRVIAGGTPLMVITETFAPNPA